MTTTYGRNVLGELLGVCTGKNLWDESFSPLPDPLSLNAQAVFP